MCISNSLNSLPVSSPELASSNFPWCLPVKLHSICSSNEPLQWLLFAAPLNYAAVPISALSQMRQKLVPLEAPRQARMWDAWSTRFPREEQLWEVSSVSYQLCLYARLVERYQCKKKLLIPTAFTGILSCGWRTKAGGILVCHLASVTLNVF